MNVEKYINPDPNQIPPECFRPGEPEEWRHWYWNEGSKPPRKDEDMEEFTVRMTLEAFKLGARSTKGNPGPVHIYRFFNFVKGKHGEPFALCDKHRADYFIPASCRLEKIGSTTDEPCFLCEENE